MHVIHISKKYFYKKVISRSYAINEFNDKIITLSYTTEEFSGQIHFSFTTTDGSTTTFDIYTSIKINSGNHAPIMKYICTHMYL